MMYQKNLYLKLVSSIVVLTLQACSQSNSSVVEPIKKTRAKPVTSSQAKEHTAKAYLQHNEIYNPESVIPPQCYTKTEGDKNPCYVCHQSYQELQRPNYVKDASLQGNYEFSDEGMKNSWKNLFIDRSKDINSITDKEILEWVSQDNYQSFIQRLKDDKDWKGEIAEIDQLGFPDKAFRKNGLAKDGSLWVAYNYKPLPSSFWPTNGSTGDAMIRLPEPFRKMNGSYSESIYLSNLDLLEKNIKGMSTPDFYLGDANQIKIDYMLYPQGTEFLHTVRYVGINEDSKVFNAPRMKEVRYMKKAILKSASSLKSSYLIEAKEKHLGQLPQTIHIGDRGIDNGFGWIINGYIEDEHGELRQQNKQELAFCNGCHKTLGSTIDQIFSFSRKLEGKAGWGYIDLTKIKDVPSLNSTQGEFLTYFERVGGGDEFRQNEEMLKRWFNPDGRVNKQAISELDSIYPLITPSKERALALNKAYKAIVSEQSYIFGRDAVLRPAKNVLRHVDTEVKPLDEQHRYQWDIRLNWSQQ